MSNKDTGWQKPFEPPKCVLDRQHGINMNENDMDDYRQAREQVNRRHPDLFNKDYQQWEVEIVLAYARLKGGKI